MVVRLWSIAHWGLEALGVEIEVDVSNRGLPGLTIVGLAGKATEEAKERVRLAISNSGFEFPNKKIVVNLAPADLPKEGSAFDLPIAVGILAAAKLIDPKLISQNEIYYGELSLDGQLRHTKGVLAAGLGAIKLKKPRLFVPRLSASQAAVASFRQSEPWKSPPPAATICFCPVRRGAARRCWRAVYRESCPV